MGEPLFSQLVMAFCAAIIIICVAMLYMMIKNNAGARREPNVENPPAPLSPAAEAVAPIEDDGALIAAISAAVAMFLAEEGKTGPAGFIVRRVRRVAASPAWQRAGRDEQVYSRM